MQACCISHPRSYWGVSVFRVEGLDRPDELSHKTSYAEDKRQETTALSFPLRQLGYTLTKI